MGACGPTGFKFKLHYFDMLHDLLDNKSYNNFFTYQYVVNLLQAFDVRGLVSYSLLWICCAASSKHLFAQQLRNKHLLTVYKTGKSDSKPDSITNKTVSQETLTAALEPT